MIASEDRHIPKTKLTHRYNPYTKSWVKKGREFNDDEQQNPLAGGQVRTEELTQSDLSSLEQADRMLDRRERLRQNAMNYGMPSENPNAKIPNPRGLSGSSGVYRTQTGRITLDDMERILGSVYAEVQKCGCYHICNSPCQCLSTEQKSRMMKHGEPVTKDEILRAEMFSLEMKQAKQQWEAEHKDEYVEREFGMRSMEMGEMQDSVKKDCECGRPLNGILSCKCKV